MEDQDNIGTVPTIDDGDERRTWIIESVSQLDAFGGWGPRMVGSSRNILRGLN